MDIFDGITRKGLVRVLACCIGGGSLVLFGLFLFNGGFELVHNDMGLAGILVWDSLLCVLFFVQHSVMVRDPFRQWMGTWLANAYHGAFYAICSGFVLIGMILLWRTSDHHLIVFSYVSQNLIHGVFLLTGLPLYLCVRALNGFDPLGLKPIIDRPHNRALNPTSDFTIRGPYRWVRHPIYLVSIIAIWASPHISADRLLFNILWTIWIYIGAYFEEKQLFRSFGDAYRIYQKNVPMICPNSIRPRI